MTLAINDAGDVLSDAGGAWKPAVRAVNDNTGESLVLDGGQWKPMPGGKAAPKVAAEPAIADQSALSDAIHDPAATTPSDYGKQTQIGADVNAAGQGLVSGTGAVIAGAGRIAQAGTGPSAQKVLAAFDLVDEGKNRDAYQKLTDSERQQVAAYRGGNPDDKASQRVALQQTVEDYGKPNLVTRAGMAVEGAAPGIFPVDPALEGVQTGVGRMIGGTVPALAGAAAGGPVGVLASLATIGSQAYETAFQDATAKGVSQEDAETAAGKSAVAQAVTMVAPVGHFIKRIPLTMREGLMKTLVNLGLNGVEFGSANAIGTFANNYVAQQTYDPGRSLTQGTGEAGLEGTIAGLIIPAAVSAMRGRPGAGSIQPVLDAPNIDTAIAEATQAAHADTGSTPTAPADSGPPPFVPPPQVVPAPSFVPPGSQIPVEPRLAAVLAAARSTRGNRPSEIPPTSAVDPLTGKAAPIEAPPVDWTAGGPATVPSWGDLFAARPRSATVDQAPALAEPLPRSLGGAASREGTPAEMIDLTTADMKANRRRAEMDELLAPPEPNDKNIYVEGSFPTLAERSGDATTSQTEGVLRERNAADFYGEGKPLTEANKSRVRAFDEQTVPDPTINTMMKDRAARWEALSEDILPTAKPADLTPAATWVSGELAKPRIQENDAIRSVLEDFQARLYDEDGNLKSDPAAVWGIHDHLQNQLAKAKDPLNQSGAEKFAESRILQAKALIDGVMNVASDNRFQGALNAYAEDSKPINSAMVINAYRPKLTNMAGELQPTSFHRFVLGLAKERGDPGIDPSMNITDDTMRSLINIDTDLKRAGLIKLGAPRGSQTNLMGALAQSIGVKAATKVAGAIPIVGGLVKEGSDAVTQLRLDHLTRKHLAPPEGGYTYPGQ